MFTETEHSYTVGNHMRGGGGSYTERQLYLNLTSQLSIAYRVSVHDIDLEAEAASIEWLTRCEEIVKGHLRGCGHGETGVKGQL